jgi:hypothetical protein
MAANSLFLRKISGWSPARGCPVLSGSVRFSLGLRASDIRRQRSPPCQGWPESRSVGMPGETVTVGFAGRFGCQRTDAVPVCDARLEAWTQFARRLSIGFGGAETNHGERDWGGGGW